MSSNTKKQRVIAILQLCLAVGFAGFWLLYFLEDTCRVQGPKLADCLASGSTTECLKPALACERYLAFENSFPLPDLGYVAPCCSFPHGACGTTAAGVTLLASWLVQHWYFWGCSMFRSTCRMLATASDSSTRR